MEDKRIYQLEVTFSTHYGEATRRIHILAESKWEAIERALTRYRDIQPDRSYYVVISGGWKYEVGKQIQLLAAHAFDYAMRYS